MCDVNIATGEVTQFEFDVLLSGRIPWRLTRRYSSENPDTGLVGFGWKLNLDTFLRPGSDLIEMAVDGEPFAQFPLIAVGQVRPIDDAGMTVARTEAGISVTDRSGFTYTFPCGDPLPRFIHCARRYDAYRNFIEYQYEAGDRLRSLIDTFGRQVVFAYDARSRLVEVYVAVGSRRWSFVRYEYDGQDDLVVVLDASGNPTRYEYSSHLLTRVTDPAGRDLYYQYDRNKRCVRTWFTGGVWDRQLAHDSLRQRVLVTHPDGYSKLFTHNGKGIVIGDLDSLGRRRDDVVDQDGRILLRAGATPTIIKRDPGSNVVLMSRNGLETIAEVNANDQVTLLRKHDGNVWKYQYDAAGSPTRSEDPTGAIWKFEYNERGDLVRYVDPTGYERNRERTADRLTLHDAWGLRQDERFDALGRVIQVIDGEGGEVRFRYDESGRPLQRINPDGTTAAVEYDAAGRPVVLTDEMGHQLRFIRDPASVQVTVRRPDGHQEIYDYGLTDELTSITNSAQEKARFTYDAAGRCTHVQYFDGRQHAIEYDDADNPVALRDGRTAKLLTKCKYVDDRLVEELYYDGRRLRIDYGPAGEIIGIENDDATLSYERDPLMRITTARQNLLELHYGYNLRGDRTSLTTNRGRRIDYLWDGRGRLVRMVDTTAGTYEYWYDARDLVTEIRLPNGCVQHFKYDRRHRMISRLVTRADGSEVCSRNFTYDQRSRLVRYVDSLRGTRIYTYDAVDFLTSVNDNGRTIPFQHDSKSNVLATETGDSIGYAAGDLAIRVGKAEIRYDERGNLVSWPSETGESQFEYTGEGWLRRARLASGAVAEYQYDGMARRIAKTVNGRRTEFEWDGVHLLSERRGSDTIEYLFMPGSFFLTGITRDGRHYSYVNDQLGTPTELVDDAGEIVWAADYTANGAIAALRLDKISQPFRYLGQYYDDELAWHYNWFRYYSPVLNRFTSPDPLCFAAGVNLYRYAPNPVNWVDPLGLAIATPASGGNPATCEVMSNCDWGPKLMKEAQKKTDGVNERGCQAIVTGPCTRPPDQKDYYMSNCVDEDDKAKVEASLKSQGDSCKSKQVDHIQEVQCGGGNRCDNLAPLTQSVNGSFGSQIRSCRNQLAAAGVTGTVKMVINLVNIRSASAAQLQKHDKQPCSAKPACP